MQTLEGAATVADSSAAPTYTASYFHIVLAAGHKYSEGSGLVNIGAFITRIEFWGPVYYY